MATVYSGLSFAQQQLYKKIQSEIEQLKIEFVFQNQSFDTVSKVYQAVLEDHPEYFWLSGSSNGTTKTTSVSSTLYFRPVFNGNLLSVDIASMRHQLEAKVSELIRCARRFSQELYEQIVYLHDYLVLHTDYQLNAPHCYDAYGCLISGRAVCSGYAAAFQFLMQNLGVECGRVHGSSASKITGEVSHVWNYIRLPDGYYFIDVTWDDPILNGGSESNNLSHSYFCLDLQEIRMTHRISSEQFIPRLYGTRYNYYRYRGWYVDYYLFDSIRDIAQKQLRNGNSFTIKFSSQKQLNLAIQDLIDNQKVYSIPGMSNRISYNVSESGLILVIRRR